VKKHNVVFHDMWEATIMIRNIPKPEISPAFTIDDIHKIRKRSYETLCDATAE
jgi:hypothetical protein